MPSPQKVSASPEAPSLIRVQSTSKRAKIFAQVFSRNANDDTKAVFRAMQLQRPDKIILAMYDLAGGTSKPLKYEDIVVKAFSLYPQDFALRGYPKYPDSSDIHKPLYGPLKRAGYILAGNKQFRLTAKGIERGRTLAGGEGAESKKVAERLSRTDELELHRIYQCDAFQLFLQGKGDRILDTDFYAYLGVTVRTDRNEFLGRLKTVEDSVKAGVRILADPRSTKTLELHEYLLKKFSELIGRLRLDK